MRVGRFDDNCYRIVNSNMGQPDCVKDQVDLMKNAMYKATIDKSITAIKQKKEEQNN